MDHEEALKSPERKKSKHVLEFVEAECDEESLKVRSHPAFSFLISALVGDKPEEKGFHEAWNAAR